MPNQDEPIKVSLYGKPSSSYLSLKSEVLQLPSKGAPKVQLTEVSDTSKFLAENIRRIPACKVNDRWILPDDDHAHYIGRVKFAISMEQQKSLIQNILVPIDLSDNSSNALCFAAGFAQDLGLPLTVLHTVHPVQGSPADASFSATQMIANRKKNVEQFVADLAMDHPHLISLQNAVTKTTVGLASTEIIHYSKEKPGTIVIMGATGSNHIKQLFGSVSLSVINQASVPILIVPGDSTYQRTTKIVYAGAIEEVDNEISILLSALVSFTQAQTEVVHVQQKNETYSPQMLLSTLCRNTKQVATSHTIEGKDVYSALNEHCLTSGTDLLVMARAKGNVLHGIFHRSATKAMSTRTHVPLLIIPQK